MYVTVPELAEYLGVSATYLYAQIADGKVQAIHDGRQYLLNKVQFEWHKEELERLRLQIEAEQQLPIPEDWDAKDED